MLIVGDWLLLIPAVGFVLGIIAFIDGLRTRTPSTAAVSEQQPKATETITPPMIVMRAAPWWHPTDSQLASVTGSAAAVDAVFEEIGQ